MSAEVLCVLLDEFHGLIVGDLRDLRGRGN